MFILSEKIAPPPPQAQTFNDNILEHAALKARESGDHWIKHIIRALSGTLR